MLLTNTGTPLSFTVVFEFPSSLAGESRIQFIFSEGRYWKVRYLEIISN